MPPPKNMKEIRITDFENVSIGQADDQIGKTGVTVFMLGKDGMPAGIDVRGGGPASREIQLLYPMSSAQVVHAIVIAGGSAFGLDAATGVMEYLEEKGIGFDVGVTRVPLVCQSDLFDLTVGDCKARPTKQMGREACLNASNYQDGQHGAGTGATVGKLLGMEGSMPSGIGSYAVQVGDLKVGAVVAVNALGDIYDWKTNEKIAGLRNAETGDFIDSQEVLYNRVERIDNKFVSNTTLAVVLTNGKFNKMELGKIASMAHNGYARAIRPVHTSADGDSIYAVSAGNINADIDATGELAAMVVAEAIKRAVK